MQKYYLNKILDVGTTYRAETDKAYVIKQIGTDSTTRATVFINESPCCEIDVTNAPMDKKTTNFLGPTDLGKLFLVVPPTKTIRFTGASGSKLRIIGEIIELAPGETLPTDLLARFTAQPRHYLTYLSFTYSHGTDAAWAAGDERVIGYEGVVGRAFTGPVKERFTLNRLLGADIANVSGGMLQDHWALRLYINDKPLDIIETGMGHLGLELWSIPLPPRDAIQLEPFTLKDRPIVIEEGTDLKVSVINISGASRTPTAGTSITVTCEIVAERELL